MYRLSSIVYVLLVGAGLSAQTPHGASLTIACEDCHNTGGWEFIGEGARFAHDNVGFELKLSHLEADCKSCHSTLVFDEAESSCISCHDDMHSMSVGDDCIRCHDERNWLVDNIPELHEINGFPLLGQHRLISCSECHLSESNLRWDWIGSDCTTCHIEDYHATSAPNHIQLGFSLECVECHSPASQSWGVTESFHLFFPLEGKHDINDCAACHLGESYSNASPECVSCHEDDFFATTSPNHLALNFGTDCTMCHIGDSWGQANFNLHDDLYFPIFFGKHEGEWDTCTDCHLGGNFTSFSCIDCHEHNDQQDLTNEHDGEDDFVYESEACFFCHPTGEED